MLIIIFQSFGQDLEKKRPTRTYINAGYLISSNANNTNTSKVLLAGNGYNLGITRGREFSPRFGIMTVLNYNFGNLSNEGTDALRKKYDPKLQMEFTQKNKTWGQAQLMTGVLLKPIKKVPLFLEATCGAGYIPTQNTVTIKKKA